MGASYCCDDFCANVCADMMTPHCGTANGFDTMMGDRMMRLGTANCNGIRKRKRRLALGYLLSTLKVGVCVVTESHLRKRGLEITQIPGYVETSIFCRHAERSLAE